MNKTIVSKIEDWKAVASKLVADLSEKKNGPKILALSGDLGVGKTTLVQQIASTLGVIEPVTSPTFTIMKRYETTNKNIKTLVHLDAYRLESESELGPLQLSELLKQPNTLFCIEWAEKIKNALPPQTTWMSLEINNDGQHTIQKVS